MNFAQNRASLKKNGYQLSLAIEIISIGNKIIIGNATST